MALRPILKIKQKKNRSQNELKLLPKVKDLPSNVDSLTDPPVSRTFKIEHMIMLVNLFRFVYRIHQLAKSIPRGKLYVLDSIIEEIESYLSGLLRKYVGLHLKALKTE